MRRNLVAWGVFLAVSSVGLAETKRNPASIPTQPSPRIAEPKEFDRLDGMGPSRKRVDVIEWEGNLELHVYPKGSVRSLGMKVDRESKTSKNPVMVVEYAFHGVPYTMIRRATFTVRLMDHFHVFKIDQDDDYDKFIISGHKIAGASPYTLAPPPTQLYPDHHPSLAQDDQKEAPAKTYQRSSASVPSEGEVGVKLKSAEEFEQDSKGTTRRRRQKQNEDEEESRIPNFAF